MKYKLSYDYSEMLQELKEELADEILKMEDFIQVLRGDSREGYEPIIDWYYDHDIQMECLKKDPMFDDENDVKEKRKISELYKKDIKSGKLERRTVTAVLTEMEEMNRII